MAVLQPTVTVNNDELERKINSQLANAKRDLDRIDRRTLPRGAQDHYDWARKFCKQAEDYMKQKSFEMADQAASKAARIASELAKGFTSPTSL